ncbi:MAG: hypothetical protein A2V45_14295 [Candidatus Aminicenantes bacterium RBG_19FT_COMBO_58_17]|nr:MAG: hypothetical protein A2V45_14295 [Candidatus Aminicenantes bacterium RBG_19FT_COMBO_58_17]
MKLFLRPITLLALALFLLPLCAYSYIDLGSGSYIIQLIIAAFVGITFSLKIYWKKIRTRFSKKEKVDKNIDVQ